VKSLFKALDIIETIAEAGETGIRELSNRMGFPPATTHRIVSALTERGYLQKTEKSHRYSLSAKFLHLADGIRQHSELSSLVRPYLEQLMRQSGENANLCVRNGMDAVYIDHVHSRRHNLRIFTRVGGRAPLYATGVGKVLLSFMQAGQLQQYLNTVDFKPLTSCTLTTTAALESQIENIRKQGYAVDDQENELGVRCVAAPLLNHKGDVVAAMSISGAAQRITRRRLSELSRMVKETAQKISERLGYVKP
jgi:DNA-binding IclR family transcriptional regulator